MNPRNYSWPVTAKQDPLVNSPQKHDDAHGQIVRSS